jgi:hypothetical protein
MLELLESRRLMSVAPIASLSLINTDTNKPVAGYAPLQSGVTLDLAKLPSHLSIQAKESGTVGSVLFGLDSNSKFHSENFAPYSVNGDSSNGSVTNSWPMTLGSHTMVVTPYQMVNDAGTAGSADTFKFTVTRSSTPSAPQVSAGGTTWHVNPTGANGASKTVSAAIALAQTGDVVLIDPGTYKESIKLTRSGTSSKPITIAAATIGSVTIDSSSFAVSFDGASVGYIHLQGIIFNGCNNPLETSAVRIGSNFAVTDVTVQNAQSQGMEVYGSNTTLLRVTAQYNGQEGLGGVNCSNVLVQDSITRFNNPGLKNPSWAGSSLATEVNGLWYVNADYESGAGKWGETNNVTLNGVQSYSNHGTGIWFDGTNTNVLIENCTVYNAIPVTQFYEGVGISIEMNGVGPVTIQNNNIYNDPGGTIVIASSRHVHVTNNTFGGSYIALNDWPRGATVTMEDVSFTRNTMNNSFIWTGGTNWFTTSGSAKDVVFDYDTYSGMTGPVFKWGTGVYQTIANVQSSLKLEAHGTLKS